MLPVILQQSELQSVNDNSKRSVSKVKKKTENKQSCKLETKYETKLMNNKSYVLSATYFMLNNQPFHFLL